MAQATVKRYYLSVKMDELKNMFVRFAAIMDDGSTQYGIEDKLSPAEQNALDNLMKKLIRDLEAE